ncbi:hypothetical protein [uncultured Draconibacterium sp.]|uniref:hypothetical protein n=1 Tax=uncultured Draconibacterium sp. TaxID=1573823 RepID=UPI003217A183
MKTTIFASMFLMHFVVFGQSDYKNRMIFPDFVQGKVFFKDGTAALAPLNYDTYEEEMIFNNNGEFMAVATPQNVAKIMIQGKTFEWLEGDVFLEKIDTAGFVMYRRNRNQLMSKGKGMPYGGVSSNAAVSTVSRLPHGAEAQAKDLTIDEEFELTPDNLFYAKTGNGFKALISAKQIGKAYDFDVKELTKYIKAEKIDMQQIQDVVQVIQHFKNGN